MNRRCRTCPAIFSAESGDQCPECSLRSSAVKDPAAVALGRRGGLKGGPARAAVLSPERRSELSSQAATIRWKKPRIPKPVGCAAGDHVACEHFRVVLETMRQWVKDMEWCPVCGVETPQDAPAGAPVPHEAACALAMLLADVTATTPPPAGHADAGEG